MSDASIVRAVGIAIILVGIYLLVARTTADRGSASLLGAHVDAPVPVVVLFIGVIVFLSPQLVPSDGGDGDTPTPSPAETSFSPSASPSPTPTPAPTPTEAPTETPTETPTFLGSLRGEWGFVTWLERPGSVTLCAHPLGGTLVFDTLGHAAWDLTLDDCGPTPPVIPSVRCLGVVDAAAADLTHWPGHLTVDGEDLTNVERDWTSNLRSLHGDNEVAWCGFTLEPISNMFVYDTTQSDFSLTITAAGDPQSTPLLTMRNAAGTFTWQKQD